MLQAHGYTPAIIYVEAGADIQKHMALSILPGGTVQPSSPSLGVVIGFAMQNAVSGAFLPVQVDGVLYGYNRLTLSPGVWYYQGSQGEITTDPSEGGHVVGFAVTEENFRIMMLVGGGSGESAKPIVMSGAESLYNIAIPGAGDAVVDGSGSLSEAVEEGWDDWASIGATGTLADMYMDSQVEGDPSSSLEFIDESGFDTSAGGELASLFGFGSDGDDSDLFSRDEGSSAGELGGLAGLLGGSDVPVSDGGTLSSLMEP